MMSTVEEIIAAFDRLSPTEQSKLSHIFLTRQANIRPPAETNNPNFWQQVEKYRSSLQSAGVTVDEIWGDVRDKSPGREVEPW
jgi:hypothetical protein